jgi:hypothetical protein
MDRLRVNNRRRYQGFVYTGSIIDVPLVRLGSEWQNQAQRAVENGGQIDRDTDGVIAVYNARRQRLFEVYPHGNSG